MQYTLSLPLSVVFIKLSDTYHIQVYWASVSVLTPGWFSSTLIKRFQIVSDVNMAHKTEVSLTCLYLSAATNRKRGLLQMNNVCTHDLDKMISANIFKKWLNSLCANGDRKFMNYGVSVNIWILEKYFQKQSDPNPSMTYGPLLKSI